MVDWSRSISAATRCRKTIYPALCSRPTWETGRSSLSSLQTLHHRGFSDNDVSHPRRPSTSKNTTRIVHPTISSLNPDLLKPSDYVDLSHATCTLFSSSDSRTTFGYYRKWRDDTRPATLQHFPYGTRGFFYCASSDAHPSIAAGLRFRITDQPSPHSFMHGRDLLMTATDLPWNIPLLAMLANPSFAPAVALMEKEGVIDPELRKHFSRIINGLPHPPSINARVIDSLRQPFAFAASARSHAKLWCVSERSVQSISPATLVGYLVGRAAHMVHVSCPNAPTILVVPYEGAALFCIDISGSTLGLRCLKILAPFRYRDRLFTYTVKANGVLHPLDIGTSGSSHVPISDTIIDEGAVSDPAVLDRTVVFAEGEMVSLGSRPIFFHYKSLEYSIIKRLYWNSKSGSGSG